MTELVKSVLCLLIRCDLTNNCTQTALAKEKNNIDNISSIRNRLDLDEFIVFPTLRDC